MDAQTHISYNPYYSSSSSPIDPVSSDYYAKMHLLRNSRAIGVLWGVFSLCYAIINVTVLLQPQWLGDTESSRGTGYFGLWKSCRLLQDGQDLLCTTGVADWSHWHNTAFKGATLLVALSVALMLLCLSSFALFFFVHSSTVFHVCGWLQATNSLFLLIACLLFPAGWKDPAIAEVCGPDADVYDPGECGVRWAFILAIIGVADSAFLSLLAFVLGSRYARLLPDVYISPSQTASLYKSKHSVNSLFVPM